MSTKLVALVTGGNQGIGLGLVEALARDARVGRVLLGSRSIEKGSAAVAALNDKGISNVNLIQLDIDSHESIEAAANSVRAEFGGLDILVNNAGIAAKGDAFDRSVAETTIHTNYTGTLWMHQLFEPLMRPNSHIVNLGSRAGSGALSRIANKSLQEQFMDPQLQENRLTQLLKQFIEDVSDSTYSAKGWPKTAYGVSKIGVNVLTRLRARDWDAKHPSHKIVMNVCCPGYVSTSMSSYKGPLTIEQGILTPLMLCFVEGQAAPNGSFWLEGEAHSLLG
ncbi:Cbr1l protein [Chytriomyces sp. MP71]|nr:Cbr1l protein [Chytriomyces sp. MP71]